MMDGRKVLISGIIVILLFISGCTKSQGIVSSTIGEEIDQGMMKLTSPAFNNNGNIPKKYTCDGENVSPGLLIGGVPKNAVSLVLIMDDPDAPIGTFVHWVAYNIDPKTTDIKEGSKLESGVNGAGKIGYMGPCPPKGTHRYFFKLYALNIVASQYKKAPSSKEIEFDMKGHIIAKAELVGLYKR